MKSLLAALAVMALAVMAAAAAPPAAQAARSADAVTPRSVVALVTDTDTTGPNRPFRAGLRIAPAPGWHVYWRNPGDAGAPPHYTVAPAAAAGPIAWPVPERIPDGPVMSFGYTQPVLLARNVQPAPLPAGAALTLRATADWLICATICVPESATLALTLPPGPPSRSTEAAAFDTAATHLPRPAAFPATIAPDGTLTVAGAPPGPAALIPDTADTTMLAAPQRPSRAHGQLTLQLTPTAAFRPAQGLDGLLVLGAGADRVAYQLQATPAPRSKLPDSSPIGWASLGLALAGGLLLNLMPCVFPVLAMKAVALARLTRQARRAVRANALAYTAGVLATCLALATLLLALRGAGQAAGWGFQLGWPPFVAAMAWLFLALGLNLSGVFSFAWPQAGAGQALTERGGTLGSLATGALAVLVATPCTAPFMGAALGAAATASPLGALAVFAALAIGFALPTLLLAAAPGLAAHLPRPGAWMEWLRQSLAFPMYAAAAWLTWVLAREAGPPAVLAAGGGFVLVGLGLWLLRLRRLAARLATAACLLAAASLLPGIGQPEPGAGEPYTAARLATLQAGHHPVLVNMTAAWCVSCQVNERLVLAHAVPGLAARHIAYLLGDWTTQDPAITAFLHQFNRDGVPLYVFFPANAPPRVLPQVLTPALLRALNEPPAPSPSRRGPG